ncbi:MAG TPA: SDR family oxidoreductase [Actinopolymorphaceae bacterium]|nr:SDR family oxidoreductase [Actinopolymorphaceae bacterium]
MPIEDTGVPGRSRRHAAAISAARSSGSGNSDDSRNDDGRHEGGNSDDSRNDEGGNDEGGNDVRLEALADQWRTNFAANVLTAVLTTEAVTDRLADGGSVISIGSIAATKGAGSYGAAKAALAAWNLSAAADLGARRITANVIAPGYIAETEFFRDRMTPERRAQLLAATLTGRTGEPDDIAATARFLASAGARHLTGQVIHVNGGAHTSR